jgi:hypothetical protein
MAAFAKIVSFSGIVNLYRQRNRKDFFCPVPNFCQGGKDSAVTAVLGNRVVV